MSDAAVVIRFARRVDLGDRAAGGVGLHVTTVRIRPRVSLLLLESLPQLFLLLPAAFFSLQSRPDFRWWAWAFVALMLALHALVLLRLSRPVDLTPTHLIQRGWFGWSIEWSRIQDVVVQGGTSVAV